MDTMTAQPERQLTAEELVEKRRLQNREAQKRRRAKLRNATEQYQGAQDDRPQGLALDASVHTDKKRRSSEDKVREEVDDTNTTHKSLRSSSSSNSNSFSRSNRLVPEHPTGNVACEAFGSNDSSTLLNAFDDIFGAPSFAFPTSDRQSLVISNSSSSHFTTSNSASDSPNASFYKKTTKSSPPSSSSSSSSSSSTTTTTLSNDSPSSTPIEDFDPTQGAALAAEYLASSLGEIQPAWSSIPTMSGPNTKPQTSPFLGSDSVIRCEVIERFSTDKHTSDTSQLLEHLLIGSEGAGTSLSSSEGVQGLSELRLFFQTQPQMLDIFISSLRLAEVVSGNSPVWVRLEMLKSVVASFKAQAFRQQSYSMLSIMPGLELRSLHLFQAVMTNAARMGYSSHDFENYNTISRIGESYLGITSASFSSSAAGKLPSSSSSSSTCPSKSSLLQAASTVPSVNWDLIPETMHPTALQLVEEHHPFLDVTFVWPSVRDKVLTLLKMGLDVDILCADLMMSGLLPGVEPAFMIWGDDSMDVDSWEVSERVATKWWFLFQPDIIRRTNWWRKQRSLDPLRIDFSRNPADSIPWTMRKHDRSRFSGSQQEV